VDFAARVGIDALEGFIMLERVTEKVQVWVFLKPPSGEIRALLLRTTPERGSFWQPVTGMVEPGETLEQAAVRELSEETGLAVTIADLWSVGHRFEFPSRWGGTARETVFAAVISVGATSENIPIIIDPSEHVAFQWVNLRQAFSFLSHESAKISLEKALKNELLKISSKPN